MTPHDINATVALLLYCDFEMLADDPHNNPREAAAYAAAADTHAASLIADGLPLKIKTPHFLITVTAIEDES